MIKEIYACDFNKEDFLANYWQQKPLLIRALFDSNLDLISPNELAGLACEVGIESRIITEKKVEHGGSTHKPELKADNQASTWHLSHGPFEESKFQNIDEPYWSLLVQSVDHWHPKVSTLLSSFNFLPAHILDDVMVSYAPAGGSVGPHFDYYDVFLVQGLGSRLWKVGEFCDGSTPVLADSDLSILQDMKHNHEMTLTTGDVLYLPPQISHYGEALEDCITYSVGFRTPSMSQSIIALTDDVSDDLIESQRLNLPLASSPFEINTTQVSKIKETMESMLLSEEILTDWYGRFATEAKNDASILVPDFEYDYTMLINALNGPYELLKNEGSRFLFSCIDDGASLFVDGRHYRLQEVAQQWLELLCQLDSLRELFSRELSQVHRPADASVEKHHSEHLDLLLDLVNHGSLYFDS